MNKSLISAAILSAALMGATVRADEPAVPAPGPGMPAPIVSAPGVPATAAPEQPAPVTAIPARPEMPGIRTIRAFPTSQATVFQVQNMLGERFNGQMNVMGKTEKAAWLGVITAKAPLAVLKQLKLKTGVLLNSVVEGSPAEKAGLKSMDLLEKLDDQLLINPSQLEGLIRMHVPGDKITLTLFHDGDRITLPATLIEHDVLVASDPEVVEPGGPMIFQPAISDVTFSSNPAVVTTQPAAATIAVTTFTTDSDSKGGSSFESEFADNMHRLTMVRRGPHEILTIKDSDGKELFKGPVETPELQNGIPADLHPLFEQMQKMQKMADEASKNQGGEHR